jgi:hypothetical protein
MGEFELILVMAKAAGAVIVTAVAAETHELASFTLIW